MRAVIRRIALRRWLKPSALTFILCAAAVTQPALARNCPGTDAAALAWIAKMSDGVLRHSYQGVVTLQRDDDMQVMQVSRQIGDSAAYETLTQLTGQGAHIRRSGHPLDCVHPGHQLLSLGADLEAGRCDITEFYQFSVAEGERVAGRQAVRILIQPRDMYRHGYLMSLDRETGLLLKTEVLGRGNQTLEKFQFANIAYDAEPVPPTDVDVVHHAGHPDPGKANGRVLLPASWTLNWLPKGFVATDAAQGRVGRRTYTDGLAVFSIFLEDLDREIRPGEGLVRSGGTMSYTRGLNLEGQPVLVTVIGEIPVNTARMVADSIRWVQ